MSRVTGNLATCGNVEDSVWAAAQHAVTIFQIAHLAQKRRIIPKESAHRVKKLRRALKRFEAFFEKHS